MRSHSSDGLCQTGTCHLPLQGLNHKLQQLLTFNIPWKFRLEIRNDALCALEKTGRTGLQTVGWFQKLILWAQFLRLLISRKALHPFMVTLAPHDEQKTSAKITWTPPSPKSHICWPSPHLFGAVSQSYLRCCLLGYSPHFVSNNNSQLLTPCFFFFTWQWEWIRVGPRWENRCVKSKTQE